VRGDAQGETRFPFRTGITSVVPWLVVSEGDHEMAADLVAAFRAEQRPLGGLAGGRWSGIGATRRSHELAAEVVESLQITAQPAPAIGVIGSSPKL